MKFPHSNLVKVLMGVEPKINRGGKIPPKWMVKIMENPMNKWMLWGGVPPILG